MLLHQEAKARGQRGTMEREVAWNTFADIKQADCQNLHAESSANSSGYVQSSSIE